MNKELFFYLLDAKLHRGLENTIPYCVDSYCFSCDPLDTNIIVFSEVADVGSEVVVRQLMSGTGARLRGWP